MGRADQDDSLHMLKHGQVCELVIIVFNMLYTALGTTAHMVRYNCFENAE